MRCRLHSRGAWGGLILGSMVLVAGAAVDRSRRDALDSCDLSQTAVVALADDAAGAEAAIARLRSAGPDGLDALIKTHSELLARATQPQAALAKDDQAAWQRLEQAIDQVAGQRYGYASRLFWYADFDQALAAARAQNKPILSLRLLGKLTHEYSCANSRFFRTTLYANAEVGKLLREQFVLHWQSVRPVPQVTIDFGDGRRIKTTLTGNSIHYVLDRDGHLIDALPGLYGPEAFVRQLNRCAEAARSHAALPESLRPSALARHHRGRMRAIEAAWAADVRRLGANIATDEPAAQQSESNKQTKKAGGAPPARRAAALAVGKGVIEVRAIAALTHDDLSPSVATSVDADWLMANTNDDRWRAIAELHADRARLDRASIEVIRRQQPLGTADVNGLAAQQYASCSGFLPLESMTGIISNFEKLMALDTVRNEYLLHRRIHCWFADGEVDTLDALNERVYAELFLTPRSDPWLGLFPVDAYLALPRNGLTVGD